jgi:hypothetical protein
LITGNPEITIQYTVPPSVDQVVISELPTIRTKLKIPSDAGFQRHEKIVEIK